MVTRTCRFRPVPKCMARPHCQDGLPRATINVSGLCSGALSSGPKVDLGQHVDPGQHGSLDLFPASPISNLGLIDKVLAPASTNKRQETIPIEWHCHTARAKSSASTPTVNERTVGRSGGLFVWVAGIDARAAEAGKAGKEGKRRHHGARGRANSARLMR